MPLMKVRQRIRIRSSGIIVHIREEGDWRKNCFAIGYEVWKAWTVAVALIKVPKESLTRLPQMREVVERDLAGGRAFT